MFDKIEFYTTEGRDDFKYIIQTYVQSEQVMFRFFSFLNEGEGSELPLIEESQFWTNEKLEGKIEYNHYSYQCIYNGLIRIPPHIKEAYREVYLCYSEPDYKPNDRWLQDRAFFVDRLGETYFNKGKNADWSKQLKSMGCQYVYRFIMQPESDLLTAPVVAMHSFPLITNLTFDKSLPFDEDTHMELLGPWVDNHRPQVKITGPDTLAPEETAEFSLEVTHQDGSVNKDIHTYLIDCKAGYAPIREVTVNEGTAKFRVTALGLKDGETLRIKVNDKVWTDYAEKILVIRSK